jgi:hypothetical protein
MFFTAPFGSVALLTIPEGIDTMLSPVSFNSLDSCFAGSSATTVATFVAVRPRTFAKAPTGPPVRRPEPTGDTELNMLRMKFRLRSFAFGFGASWSIPRATCSTSRRCGVENPGLRAPTG